MSLRRILSSFVLAILAVIVMPGVADAGVASVRGGQKMTTPDGSCTINVPVYATGNGAWYALTAGHCITQGGKGPWYTTNDRTLVGSVVSAWVWSAAGDFAAIKSPYALPGSVVSNTRMTSYRDPARNDNVCIYGGVTGRQCGNVVSTGQPISYDGRTVNNLAIVQGPCLIDGDSGSPAVVNGTSTLVGIAVATSRNSSGTCYSYLQSVAEPMRLWNLVLR